MPDRPEILSDRARGLEDEFFRREDARLLKRLRELKEAQASREALAKTSGITNEAILNKLMELGIRAEIVAALSVVPLAEVAWADGSLDAKEKQAILARADKAGFQPGSTNHELLQSWLEHKPEARLLTAWTHMVQGLCEHMSHEQVESLRSDLLGRARGIALASGGFLGLGDISSAEEEVLKRLDAAFGPSR